MSVRNGFDVRNRDRIVSQESFFSKRRLPVSAVLDNVRSAFNVGNMFRTADAARMERLYLCGCTPCPSNPKIEKTALGAERYVPWEYFPDAADLIAGLKRDGMFIVAMETAGASEPFYDADLPEGTVFVLGNEVDGLGEGILSLADAVVELPSLGMKNSLNVGNAFAIAVYEFLRRYGVERL